MKIFQFIISKSHHENKVDRYITKYVITELVL